MRTFILALPAVALLMTQSAAPPLLVVPDSPDLLIKTRRTFQGGRTATPTIETLYLKGARQRRESRYGQQRASIVISQCDERRILQLNDEARTYAYEPIQDPSAYLTHMRALAHLRTSPSPPKPGPAATTTIDIVDTGERRPFGSYSARHVTTTRTTASAMAARARTEIANGWYIDVPEINCWAPEVTVEARLVLGGTGVRVNRHGDARRGFSIEETYSATQGSTDKVVATVELVEVSEALLDDALFTVPPDYRPALPTPGGGHDLSRPDTVMNRLTSYRDAFANLVTSWFGSRGY